MDICPCGSGREYADCCGQYIEGKASPPSAEALMRSRYSAYVEGAVDYIVETCADATGIDRDSTRRWSDRSQWLGLKIHRVEKGTPSDTTGEVDFSATYVLDGLRQEHRENAQFEKKDGRWYYTDGEVTPATVVRTEPKVGRNDPCPCGSGKKYKKCCGAGV
jgi:SEC-C motif-containing protein